MPRVTTEVTIENLGDIWDASLGRLPADRIRRVVVPKATVDIQLVSVSLPRHLIRELGIERRDDVTQTPRRRLGQVDHWPVRLTIQGRSCSMDIKEVPDTQGVSIGHTVLTQLDLLVDSSSHSLVGKPDYGDEPIHEMS